MASVTKAKYLHPAKIGAALTDSQGAHNNTFAWSRQMWQHQLDDRFRQYGIDLGMLALGKSGDTSTDGLARAPFLHRYGTLDLGVVALAVNDSGGGIVEATTRQNNQAIIQSMQYGASGQGYDLGPIYVATPSALPGAYRPGQRLVVLNDNDTTGGVAATPRLTSSDNPATTRFAVGVMLPTITGTVSADDNSKKITVWECRSNAAGVQGWGRVVTNAALILPTHCLHTCVHVIPYRNFTTGGDTPTVENVSLSTYRAAQRAAASAQNILVGGAASCHVIDIYAFQKARIVAGVDPDFTAVAYDSTRSYTTVQNNQHQNPYGNSVTADCYLDATYGLPTAALTALAAA